MNVSVSRTAFADSPWKNAELFVNEKKVLWGEPFLLIRESENKIRVDAPKELGEDIRLGLGVDGGLEFAAVPTFGSPVRPEGRKFNWTIRPVDARSSSVTLVFYNATVSTTLECKGLVMSARLDDEAKVRIDGEPDPVDGNIFLPGEKKTVTLVPNESSPLSDWPVSLRCAIQSDPDLMSVESDPDFDSEQVTYSWDVTARGKGSFQLSLAGKGMTTPLTLAPSKVINNPIWEWLKFELNWEVIQDKEKIHVLPDSRLSNSLKFQAKNPDLVGELLVVQLRDGYIPNGARLNPTIPQPIQETHGAEWHVSFERFVSPGKFSVLVFLEDRPDQFQEIFFEIVNV